jgi:phospholipid-binding lipoprotein MlaA
MLRQIVITSLLLTGLCFAPGWSTTALAQFGDGFEGSLDETTQVYENSRLETFNETMFDVNIWMDEKIMRPVARGYAKVLPEEARSGVQRFFSNLGVIPRFANSVFQLKFNGAAREASRFMINTTIGGLGFFDVAKNQFGLEESNEDFGQTLGHYGVGDGAYLVLPFVGPSTVRDTFGFVIDGAMDPKQYLLSGTENLAISTGTTVASAVNERSLNLELFEQVDRFSLDLYSAAQDFYLQRREQQIGE